MNGSIVVAVLLVVGVFGLGWTVGDLHRLRRERELARLVAACQAYDRAIQRAGLLGQSWVEADDLDALYAEWITAAADAAPRGRA